MEPKDVVSRKWKKLYTYLLLANLIYIIIFYVITQLYS